MILADKDIKEYISDGRLITSGYDEQNLNGVSYDLTIGAVCDDQGAERQTYDLHSGEVVFIKTVEKLSIPENILGRIAEKNSRMRQGLKVDGPHYQPGHVTYAFLRVQNLSRNVITLEQGMKIAQIIFEQLTQIPQKPYSAQETAAFQNEERYIGLGSYKEEYQNQVKQEYQKAKEELDGVPSGFMQMC